MRRYPALTIHEQHKRTCQNRERVYRYAELFYFFPEPQLISSQVIGYCKVKIQPGAKIQYILSQK